MEKGRYYVVVLQNNVGDQSRALVKATDPMSAVEMATKTINEDAKVKEVFNFYDIKLVL